MTPVTFARAAASSSSSPATTSIWLANVTDNSVTSAGPRPFKVSKLSMISSALPTARPSGASIAVSTARVGNPTRRPISTIASASWRAWPTVFMNAPRPTLTSSTSASAPSAIFLLMIEDAISGTLSIVPVTSRSA